MSIFITQHAIDAARDDNIQWSLKRMQDEAISAMLYGKRKNNAFIYRGVVFGFNPKLDTLKTVYRA